MNLGSRPTELFLATALAALALFVWAPAAAADDITVERSAATGELTLLGAGPGTAFERPQGLEPSTGPRRTALAYADELGPRFGVAGGSEELTVASKEPSVAGGTTVRLEQRIGTLPVIAGELQVNLTEDGELVSIGGEAAPDAPPATTPQVSAAQATETAIAAVAKEYGVLPGSLVGTEPELAIFDSRLTGGPGLGRPQLVWQLEVGTRDGDVQAIEDFVAVDALAGFTAIRFPLVHRALARVVCDAANDPTGADLPCTAPFARTETGPASTVDDVNLAFEFAGDTYELFASVGRDSLDDEGMPLVSTTRYCDPAEPCPYENAFWDGRQMVYGDGFAAADDVVGHELAHGVTDFSSHLFYYYQSGAINESLSDVFGEFVDLTNDAGTDTAATRWQLGEDLPSIGAIRDLSDPRLFGHPDRTGSPLYAFDPETSFAEGDSGGVHSNSGVNNKAAFLMTDGGRFNGITVNGLGIEKVKRLYYLTNNSLLGPGSDYQDLAAALRQACSTLAADRVAGISRADCTQVDRAVKATQMDTPPAAKPARNLPACDEPGDRPANVYFENFERQARVEAAWGTLTDAGKAEWYFPASENPYFDATYSTSGRNNLWGLDQPDASDTSVVMRKAVKVPKNGKLRFNHSYGFETSDGLAYDGGTLVISTDRGSTWVDAGELITGNGYSGTVAAASEAALAGKPAFVGESGGYLTTRANLSSLAGEKVRIGFRMATDTGGADYGWFIDDVQIYACNDPKPPETTITKAPGKVRSSGRKAKARIKFTGTDDRTAPASLGFQCRVGGGDFRRCSSPARFRLKTKRGKGRKHTIAVRAVDSSGNVDPTPDTVTVRAKRKPARKQAGR